MSPPGGLAISEELAEAMLAHARAEAPIEACGLLSGDAAAGSATTYHPARNALGSPLRFDLHPEDLVRITFEIESAGQELVAVFHSHPRSPAVPSATDLREARYPVLQLLAGMPDAEAGEWGLRAWRVEGERCAEVPLRIS